MVFGALVIADSHGRVDLKKLSPDQLAQLEHLRRKRERVRIQRSLLRRKRLVTRNTAHFPQAMLVRTAGNIERILVEMPTVFSFERNFDASAGAINLIRESIINRRIPALVDFSNVEFVGAAAALVLTAEIFRSKYSLMLSNGRRTVSGTYPKNPIAHKILHDIGFYKAIQTEGLETTDEDMSHIHIGMRSFTRIEAAEIESFRDLFLTPFPHLERLAHQRMQGAVVEAMSNCFDHAFASAGDYRRLGRRAWLSGYIDLSQNEFMMMVFDQGAGIPRTVEANWMDKLRAFGALQLNPTEGELIAAATDMYRTSTGQIGRGRGFDTMKRFVDVCEDGELRVFSNRGKYVYTRNENLVPDDATQTLGGTLVQWRIRQKGQELPIGA